MINPASDTRDRIVQAARQLFHSRGYNDVGVAEICSTARVVKGSFYHCFDGKQDLLEAVVRENGARLMTGLAAIDAAHDTGRDRVVAQLDAILAEARAGRRSAGTVLGCNLGNITNELSVSNDGAQRALRSAFKAWLRHLERNLQKGIDDGSLPGDLHARETATALLALIQGMSTLGRTFNDPAQLDVVARVAVRHLLPGPG